MYAKFGLAGILLVMAMTSAIAPRYFMSTNIYFFSLGNMMASGVLLAASLVHILPDAEQLFREAAVTNTTTTNTNSSSYYPWASFICGISFMALLALEELLHGLSIHGDDGTTIPLQQQFYEQKQPHQHYHHSSNTNNYNEQEDLSERSTLLCSKSCSVSRFSSSIHRSATPSPTAQAQAILLYRSSVEDNGETPVVVAHKPNSLSFCQQEQEIPTTTTITTSCSNTSCSATPFHPHPLPLGAPLTPIVPVEPHTATSYSSWMNTTFKPNNEHYHDEEHLEKHLHSSAASAVALTLALGIHSLLEGFVLGMSNSRTIVSISIAILFHKVFAGFALGSTLTAASNSISNEKFLIMVYLFSVSTPIGIIIAAILESHMELNTIAVATLQAAVSGTFLYISIVEVGMKELLTNREQQRGVTSSSRLNAFGTQMQFLKLSCLLLGYCFMSYLSVWV